MEQQQSLISRQPQSVGPVTKEAMATMKETAAEFFKSGMCPVKFKNPEQVLVVALYGRELGLSMMKALKEIHVINNVPGISANLMLTLIRERMPKAVINFGTTDDKICEITCARQPGVELATVEYTIEEARVAGLLGKDNWKHHPKDMLFARCISRMAKWYFSDVVNGYVHTPDELEEGAFHPATPAQAIEEAKTGEGRMPKAQVIDAKPNYEQTSKVEGGGGGGEVVSVDAGPVGAPPEAPDADAEALQELVDMLAISENKNSLGMDYDHWRREHAGHPALLVKGYDAYNQRLAELKG